MNKTVRLFLVTVLLVCFSGHSHASRIKSGFEAIKVQDYFKAMKMLKKGLKYNPSPSSYGLAIVYSRNDNPFFDKDSAYFYILLADSSWSLAKDKKKEKWKNCCRSGASKG